MNADRTVSATLVAKVAGFTGPMSTAAKSSSTLAATVSRNEKRIQQDMIRTGATAKARSGAAVGALSGLAATSGMFGPLGGALSQVQMGLQGIEGVGKRTGATMIGVGAAAAGAGMLMVRSAEKDVQAHKQLEAAVKASGHAYAPYAKGIEEAVKSQEKFGHTADDTQEALRRLTQSTGDPAKALEHMGVVANLAAAQHISLAEASTMVSRVLAGKGGRALSMYGITMDKSIKDPAQRGQVALDQLSKKLDGQASASVDSFSGRLHVFKTQAEDAFNTIGAKVGPVLAAVGPAMALVGAAAEIMGARSSRAALNMANANSTAAAAAEGLDVSNTALAHSAEEVDHEMTLAANATADFADSSAAAAGTSGAATAAIRAEGASAASAATATEALAASEVTAAESATVMAGATTRATVANAALAESTVATRAASGGLAGGLAKAAGVAAIWYGVALGVSKVADAMNGAAPDADKLAGAMIRLNKTGTGGGALDEVWGPHLNKFDKELKQLAEPSKYQAITQGLAKVVTFGQMSGTRDVEKMQHNFESIDKALTSLATGGHADLAAAQFQRYADKAKLAGMSTADLEKVFPGYTAAVYKAGNATAVAAGGFTKAAAAAGALARAFVQLSANASVDKAIIAAADASRTFADTLKSSGHAMDINTVKGAAMRSGLIDIAAANKNVYDQMIAANVPADVAATAYNKLTTKLRAQMVQAHYTNKEIDGLLGRYSTHIPTAAETAAKAVVALNVKFAAQRVAAEKDSDSHDRLGRSFATVAGNARKIPPKVSTSVSTPGLSASEAAMRTYLGYLRGVPARIVTDIISTHHDSFGAGSATGGPVHRAAGGPSGFLTGPGTATSDSIPMMLSNGEYVQKAAAVVKYGRPFMDSVNAGTYRPSAYTPGQARTELHPADRQLIRQLVSSGMTYSPTIHNPLPERASDSAVVNLRRLQYAIRP